MKRALNRSLCGISGFVDLFVQRKGWYGSWARHVDGWYRESLAHPARVLFVHFEDMKLNLRAVVLRVAQFLGIDLLPGAGDEGCLERVLHHCSFSFMKTAGNGLAFEPRSLPCGAAEQNDLKTFKIIRQGEVTKGLSCSPHNEHTPEQDRLKLLPAEQEAVDSVCTRELQDIKSPYLAHFSAM